MADTDRTDVKSPSASRNSGKIDAEAVRRAAARLRAGGLVAFPTETVYGLGAAATDDRAVASIFDAKERPRFNPLIVHVPDAEAAARVSIWSKLADDLAKRFWPGPLTLIVRGKPDNRISPLVTAGGETIAIRAPRHPLASALLRETGLPIAAPSANRSGRISPTTAAHVRMSLGDRVDMILDGGACPVGVESTVLDVTGDKPHLLRPGGLARGEIEAVAGRVLEKDAASDGETMRSPGQLASHYAPRHRLRLNAEHVAADEALLAFGPDPLQGAEITVNLSETGDLREAAANLFSMLHHLDRQKVRGIAAMPIPASGLGEAICDRLRRAAIQ